MSFSIFWDVNPFLNAEIEANFLFLLGLDLKLPNIFCSSVQIHIAVIGILLIFVLEERAAIQHCSM